MILGNYKVGLLLATFCLCHHHVFARSGKVVMTAVDDLDEDSSTTYKTAGDKSANAALGLAASTVLPTLPVVQTTACTDDGTNVSKTLVFTSVIFRHGDKFKEEGEFFSKDPYKIEDPFWLPFGLGQLRNMGKQRMYWLGQFLRMRYGAGFLKEEYFYRDILAVSADTDKNLMSAQLVLLGLFPPRGVNIWNDNVGRFFQPIPVHGIQADLDNILHQIPCIPYYDQLKKVFVEDLAELNAKHKDLFLEVSKNSGNNITNLGDLWQIYNIIRIEFENGRALPEWVKPLYPAKIKALALTTYDYFVKTDFMKTIRSGPLISILLDDMALKLNKTMDPDYKIKLYSTTDITLMSLLKTLGVDEKEMEPEYGACIMIEMHKIQEKYFIKVQYMDNGFKRYCKPLKFKGYDSPSPYLIPYEKFVTVNSKYQINEEEWYKKCSIPYC
uniref:acid phosphatase n=1 Tax=Cacopsylla melanoneura TaxID=428564 RepID=A0A8D8WKM5_9HEMI